MFDGPMADYILVYISIGRRFFFVYHHWGYTSIYRSLFYPFRFMELGVKLIFLL